MNNFNQEDLVQYLYKETSPEKTAAITAALSTDYHLREAMEILEASYKKLDEVPLLSPRIETLDAIFNYAEKSAEALHA